MTTKRKILRRSATRGACRDLIDNIEGEGRRQTKSVTASGPNQKLFNWASYSGGRFNKHTGLPFRTEGRRHQDPCCHAMAAWSKCQLRLCGFTRYTTLTVSRSCPGVMEQTSLDSRVGDKKNRPQRTQIGLCSRDLVHLRTSITPKITGKKTLLLEVSLN
jgi:hypothetical protein